MSGAMNDQDETDNDAIEAGITAASEEISCLVGRGRRWAAWGEKEMLIATTAATVAIAHLRKLQNQKSSLAKEEI